MKPVIYQLLPRLFGNRNAILTHDGTISQNGCGKLADITPAVLRSIASLGCTHVWLTGVIEHAHATVYPGITPDNPQVVKGRAGSPYAISDYYDVDPDLAVDPQRRMEEFEATVQRVHRAGLRLVLDFVPNHVARRYHSDARPADAPADLGADDDTSVAFSADNNFYYMPGCDFVPPVPAPEGCEPYSERPARASGNDCFTPTPGRNDWYETVKLNYGIDYAGGGVCRFNPVPSTWHKMIHILLYWAGKGVDAFRCDMAHMVPLQFWTLAISTVKSRYPGVQFIAEIYDVALYRDYIFKGGFDYLYDKVNLYDTLRAIQTQGLTASAVTGAWMTVDGLEDHLLNFLENHDEQRYASDFYACDPMRAVPALAVAALLGRGAMMIYAGQELGERGMDAEGFSGRDGRTTIFDYWSLSTLRRWLGPKGRPSEALLTPRERSLRDIYGRILQLCNDSRAISEGDFFDVMYANRENPTVRLHEHYVWVRHCGEDVVVVAANFSGTSADLQLTLPEHLFATTGLRPKAKAQITDLMGHTPDYQAPFRACDPLPVYIPAQSVAILTVK